MTIAQGFSRTVHRIDGVETVVHEIGAGHPLVHFHDGNAAGGDPAAFAWARDLAASFRVILPLHPTCGEGEIAGLDDYLIHYEMLFAGLELDRIHLSGEGLGACLAALYAGGHAEEIGRLALISPAGPDGEGALALGLQEDAVAADARLRETLEGFDSPALLLLGGAGDPPAAALAGQWQAALPTAQLAVIEGEARLSLKDSERARAALRAFLLG